MFKRSQIHYVVKAILTDAVEVSIDDEGNTAYEVLCEANALMNYTSEINDSNQFTSAITMS